MNESLIKVNLITRTKSGRDPMNQIIYTETCRTVYAQTRPVSRSEYLTAGQLGISPELFLVVSAFDYNGELLLEYNGQKYRIYRTYIRNGNETELYCTYAAGANGG